VVAALGAGLWLRSLWAAIGVTYAAAIGAALIILRDDPALGLKALFFVFAVVWGTDTAAYFVGRRLGGPKLWPAVSPKKTWSGAIGGAIVGVALSMLVAWIMGVPVTLSLAIVAAGLSIISQCGDLFESAVKRRFGVKDSGALIPGHGGIMDRIDALAFAVVAAVLVGWFNGEWPLVASGLLLW
jgi:phosphatidate cytidylyltransferase